jgi:DNA-binding response OmpR family regulator
MNRISFDLFLVDVALDFENDGYRLAQLIREQLPLTPIIFISGRKSENDIITGLESGADYYITKPFSPKILRAQVLSILDRMNALTKKKLKKKETLLVKGDFVFDHSQYQLKKNGQPVNLSSKEIELMLFFMENPKQVLTKEQIYTNVWTAGELDENLIMVYINYLRKKIETDPKDPHYLKTVWGKGYTFIPDGKES